MISFRNSQSIIRSIGFCVVGLGLLALPVVAGSAAPDVGNQKTSPFKVLVKYTKGNNAHNAVAASGATYLGTAGDAEVWLASAAQATAIAGQGAVDRVSVNHKLLATGTPA